MLSWHPHSIESSICPQDSVQKYISKVQRKAKGICPVVRSIMTDRLPTQKMHTHRVMITVVKQITSRGQYFRHSHNALRENRHLLNASQISPLHILPSYFVLQLQTEIKIHRMLKHSFIVKFERFFEDNTNVYMVLELCNNNVSIAL